MLRLFCLLVASAAIVSCLPQPNRTGAPESGSGIYSSASILEFAKSDYQGAMKMVGDGLLNGNISPLDAYTLYANLTYIYTDDYAAAAEYLRKALDLEEARNSGTRADLLYHLATILRSGRDYTGLLSACAEGRECARVARLPFKEHSFDFMAGNGLFDIGEDQTGLKMMRSSLSKAASIVSSEEDYGHLVYFSLQLTNNLIEKKEYREALEQCSVTGNLMERMEKKYPQAAPHHMDRFRFDLSINKAICNCRLGNKAAEEEAYRTACSRAYSQTSGGKYSLIDYYSAAGQPESIIAIYSNDLPYNEADTVTRSYRMRLSRLKDAYANAGNLLAAGEYEKRITGLSRQIEEKEYAEGVLVNAARYDALRYRYLLGDTESALKKNRWIMFGTIAVLILLSFIFFLQNEMKSRQHKEETDSLRKSLLSIQRQVSIISENKKSGDTSAPQPTLRELIEGKKLYLNKNLNRENAAAILGVSPNVVGKMLNEIEPGMSFPDYIKGLRIRHALELLGQDPDIPISNLADQCGFYTVRTLQRSFLAVTGKTPSEYARGLKG
ncbi:MAG: AraC family transcriptional regulator [Bacteroidales bacterium]|nr:AraC family transcriptional regulator [Bacteroidales bacterium]